MSPMQITLCLSSLMLTGSATPYLHNGDEDGKVGITGRNDIGFLIWEKDAETTAGLSLGSRFKTPLLPVWVARVNGGWGVLFNPNKDLMKTHSAENRSDLKQILSENFDFILRFQLYYFSNANIREKKDTILDIDTGAKKVGTNDMDIEDADEIEDPLERAIQTK